MSEWSWYCQGAHWLELRPVLSRLRGRARVPMRCRTAEAAPSTHAAPTHRTPFHSGLFRAAVGAWLSVLRQLLLLLLLALGLLEEALLLSKRLPSFCPLLGDSEVPVERKEGS